MDVSNPEAKAQRFELLHRIGVALASEHDRDKLIETILLEAKSLCHADGGTLYLVENRKLRFAMIHTDSLGVAQGGSTGNPIVIPPIALFDEKGRPNRASVATCAYHDRSTYHIRDAYADNRFDQSGFRTFDQRHNYRSVSLLAIPLTNSKGRVLAVLQLINARSLTTGQPIPFDPELQRTVEALAAQAGIALDNQELLESHRNLLDAFIRLIAAAIDAKSPYTGAHCERVPILTELIVKSLCEVESGPFAGFNLTEEEWRELRVAAWLHDCGKVTTPVHVMDKATKLEAIVDRIAIVEARYEVLQRDAELVMLRALAMGAEPLATRKAWEAERDTLVDELNFLRKLNVGAEFVPNADLERLSRIAKRTWVKGGLTQPVLDADLVENLGIQRGTLTESERLVINGHMVQTLSMLERLPFPPELQRVPEYAAGHHERMDGKGYPRGIFAGDMSIPARVLAIADVFEALTADDRPYKKGKTLSESIQIMANMKRHNHLDPVLLDHFVTSDVYLTYAQRFLRPQQIDAVDAQVVLSVEPQPFELPELEERRLRWQKCLPIYRELFPALSERPPRP